MRSMPVGDEHRETSGNVVSLETFVVPVVVSSSFLHSWSKHLKDEPEEERRKSVDAVFWCCRPAEQEESRAGPSLPNCLLEYPMGLAGQATLTLHQPHGGESLQPHGPNKESRRSTNIL